MKFTQEQKRCMYRLGAYEFNAPPVQHAKWDEDDWIAYIGDSGWRPDLVDGSANTTDRHVKLYP